MRLFIRFDIVLHVGAKKNVYIEVGRNLYPIVSSRLLCTVCSLISYTLNIIFI